MKDIRKTVLIVEDHSLNRKMLHDILADEYHIIEAANGQEGLKLLTRYEFGISAILLDLYMPVMDGFAFLAAYKKTLFNELPVLVLTGDRNPEIEQKALAHGAWDFLSKPYNASVLLSRLSNAISRSQATIMNKMQYSLSHDALTGLYNRTRFFAETRKMLDKFPSRQFAMLRFDIDRFHLVNSLWGEAEGDSFLCFIADFLMNLLDEYEFCVFGRVHADIFGVCASFQGNELNLFANRIVNKLSEYNKDYFVEPSIGIYLIEDNSLPVETIFSRAAMAAKTCKDKYLKYIAYYEESMGEAALREQAIINESKKALENHEFSPYFQPQYSLLDEKPCGAEALARWIHPERGIIYPEEFIPVFEKNGFIGKLDYYMWECVCSLLRKWIDEGYEPAPISVNVSRVNMYNPNIVTVLKNLVDQYGVSPSLLNLELSESAYMDNPSAMRQVAKNLQDVGFLVIMDDFGKKYSSLNTLKDIPVNILKIDARFLSSDKSVDCRGEKIMASIIRTAGELNIPVAVEGVETSGQRDFLRNVSRGYVQGFYYAEPLPVWDYEELIASGNTEKAPVPVEDNGAFMNMIWSSDSDIALLYKSIPRPLAFLSYEENNEKISLLRVNSSFHKLLGDEISLNDMEYQYKEAVDNHSLKRFKDAAREAINSPDSDSVYVWERADAEGAIQESTIDLRFLGKSGNAYILLILFR